jgi:hypothetical protein
MRQHGRPHLWEHGFVVPQDPGTIAIASLAMGAVGTGASVLGQMQQGQAQAGMANYQAQVARNNQQIADWNAQRALQQGQVAEQQQRTRTAQLLGAQRAALASQGGDVDSGSPLDIQGDTARAGEFDAQAIRNNAALQAYGYRVQAANAGGQAGAASASAANTMAALPFGIGSSLLGGARGIMGGLRDVKFSSGTTGGGFINDGTVADYPVNSNAF